MKSILEMNLLFIYIGNHSLYIVLFYFLVLSFSFFQLQIFEITFTGWCDERNFYLKKKKQEILDNYADLKGQRQHWWKKIASVLSEDVKVACSLSLSLSLSLGLDVTLT